MIGDREVRERSMSGRRPGVDPVQATRHDVANVVVLGILNAYNLSLWRPFPGPHWRALWLGGLASPAAWEACFDGSEGSTRGFIALLITYLLADSAYLALRPRAVADVTRIVIHHGVCIAAVAVCLLDVDGLGYLVSATAWVEVNTWALTVRRLLKQQGGRRGGQGHLHAAATVACDALFFGSWVLYRLVITPSLLLVSLHIHAATTPRPATWPLCPALAPVLAGFGLCYLNFYWTCNLLASTFFKRSSHGPSAEQMCLGHVERGPAKGDTSLFLGS